MAGGQKRRHHRSWPLLAALVVVPMGTNMLTPLYGRYEDAFGFSSGTVTAVFAVYCLVMLPALLVCGRVADRYPRRMVLFGLVVMVLASLLLAGAQSTAWLFAARVLQALAVGSCFSGLTVATMDVFSGTARTPAAAHLSWPARRLPLYASSHGSTRAAAAQLFGAGAGPVLSGALASWAPAPTTLTFVGEAVLVAALVVPTVRAVPGQPVPAGDLDLDASMCTIGHIAGGAAAAGALVNPGRWWACRRLWLAGAASGLVWAVAAVALTVLPQVIEQITGVRLEVLTGGASGALLIAAAAVQLLPVPDRRRADLRPGLLSTMIGAVVLINALLLPVSGQLQLAIVFLATCMLGVGLGQTFAAALHTVDSVAPTGERARFAAAFYVLTYVGEGLPVLGVGMLADEFGLPFTVASFAAVAAGCAFALRAAVHRRDTGSTSSAPAAVAR